MGIEEGSNLAGDALERLNETIIRCERCPRLVQWCRNVAEVKRASFQGQTYWGKPVPNFGDPHGDRLIVGLAPAAHGGNRTGRLFTGDRSGDWIFEALHLCGLANQPTSLSVDDGLRLIGAYMTPIVHCAPPDNKPTPDEIKNCQPYLEELLSSRKWRAILCLGSMAWNQVHRVMGRRAPKFGHGVVSADFGATPIVASYHPSQQNTFTGRLTMPMLVAAIEAFLAQPLEPH